MPLQNKVRRLYLYLVLQVLRGFIGFRERTVPYLRTWCHNVDPIIACLCIPFGPSIENAKPTKERETDTRQPHIRYQPYVSSGTSLA